MSLLTILIPSPHYFVRLHFDIQAGWAVANPPYPFYSCMPASLPIFIKSIPVSNYNTFRGSLCFSLFVFRGKEEKKEGFLQFTLSCFVHIISICNSDSRTQFSHTSQRALCIL
ncbi:hypothetical protein ATANTOWER_020218 [Ataeniobius toweri]|uniref:Uncharacterized protein n=1 Tax=Ataeniobius toweri TaxID=208326 RepID=A0ABU7ALD3_9TELE|nr:hypothetical protein [Ataeniobius toweri]